MNDTVASSSRVDGSGIRWSAIFAGTVLAMGMYFLLANLGEAAGFSTNDKMDPTFFQMGAAIWSFFTIVVALFIGGLATSLFTVGASKLEAAASGIIMWSLLFAALLVLGAAEIRTGFGAMAGMARAAHPASTQSWESGARAAGVTAAQIEDWKQSTATTEQEPRDQQSLTEGVTRIRWYALAGTWISMFAAVAGALVGAGPVVRTALRPRLVAGTGALQSPYGFSGHTRMPRGGPEATTARTSSRTGSHRPPTTRHTVHWYFSNSV